MILGMYCLSVLKKILLYGIKHKYEESTRTVGMPIKCFRVYSGSLAEQDGARIFAVPVIVYNDIMIRLCVADLC
jgi:hypothetical protein